MADQYIQVQPDSNGKKVDVSDPVQKQTGTMRILSSKFGFVNYSHWL